MPDGSGTGGKENLRVGRYLGWALSRFPQGRLWGRSSVPLRERLGGKICDSVCFEIRARQKNWVGRRYGGALAGLQGQLVAAVILGDNTKLGA